MKFYRRSLYDGVLLQGGRFDGFSHVEDWVPQGLVTATARTRSRGDGIAAARLNTQLRMLERAQERLRDGAPAAGLVRLT